MEAEIPTQINALKVLFVADICRRDHDVEGSKMKVGVHSLSLSFVRMEKAGVTRLGKFFKFLATNLISKVAQMSNLEHRHFLSQTPVTNFWAIFEKNWAIFHSVIWSHWIELT